MPLPYQTPQHMYYISSHLLLHLPYLALCFQTPSIFCAPTSDRDQVTKDKIIVLYTLTSMLFDRTVEDKLFPN